MKKQLLIAAVAATMASVSMADISITGDAKVNYTNVDSQTDANDTNAFKNDINLTLAGSNGGTNVLVRASVEQSDGSTTEVDNFQVEDAYVTTSIGDVNVKFGQYNNTSDSMLSNATNATIDAGRFTADTTIGGVKLTYVDQNDSAEAVIISGEVSGVAISHKMGNAGAGSANDYTDTKISGSVAGIDIAYRTKQYDTADTDMGSLEVTGEFNGVTLTYAQAERDASGTDFAVDGVLGEYAALNNIKGVKASTSLAGNTVAVTVASTEADKNAATSNDYTKFVVTRPLAAGATFEATYTDLDAAAGSTSDSKTLDLELAVKF